MAPTAAAAAAEVGTTASATAAEVRTSASAPAMRREFRSAGVVSTAHSAAAALRVQIGCASRADFAEAGGTVQPHIPLARHCTVSDVPVSAFADFAATIARRAIGGAFAQIATAAALGELGSEQAPSSIGDGGINAVVFKRTVNAAGLPPDLVSMLERGVTKAGVDLDPVGSIRGSSELDKNYGSRASVFEDPDANQINVAK